MDAACEFQLPGKEFSMKFIDRVATTVGHELRFSTFD
jgi:hypothetical protein